MKKFILTILAAAGTILAAEAQPGSILVFGNVGVQSVKNDDKSNTMNWNVTPGVGYQFTNHWTVGLSGGYGSKANKPDGGKWSGTKDWQIGAFGRYTQSLGSIFSVYGQLDAGYQNEHASADGKTVENSNLNGFYAQLTPAIAINVYKTLALNFNVGGLGYNSMKSEVSGSNPTNTFKLNFGQSLSIGLSKNFGGHHAHGHHEPMDETRKMDTSDDDSSSKKKKHSSDDDE
ncbi:outer membrane beta-barrel protein [Taibaiella soli]|uniref:Outer membrane protein beta-barrel domain-containing protein n=1 Tax=Taibaiella soli TaxID=1649169 RepID=A0A2W2ACB3_9BACT|nr:outer membrane beta-barrel protein [Taibaiella soli]PZF72931.1 hypothetical protein DN068_11000 [Taibaiella soli]